MLCRTRPMLRYYWRVLCVAFRHPWSVYEFLSSLAGLFIPLLQKLNPTWDQATMNELGWKMAAWAFGLLVLARVVLAPWWMHKEQEDKLEASRNELDQKDALLANQQQAAEAERRALQEQIRQAQRSNPIASVIRHGIESFIKRFEDMEGRAAPGGIPHREMWCLEKEASQYLSENLPAYTQFAADYPLMPWPDDNLHFPHEAAVERCRARLSRLREALRLLS